MPPRQKFRKTSLRRIDRAYAAVEAAGVAVEGVVADVAAVEEGSAGGFAEGDGGRGEPSRRQTRGNWFEQIHLRLFGHMHLIICSLDGIVG